MSDGTAEPPLWRAATPDDLPSMLAIQAEVHPLLPEREDVFADKLRWFAAGCRILERGGVCLGYGIAHPWTLDDIHPLDTLFAGLPAAPECIFIHDVALRPAARGLGAGRGFVRHAAALARRLDCRALALVSVYRSWPIWSACGFDLRAVPGLRRKLAPYGEAACYMTANLAAAEAASSSETS